MVYAVVSLIILAASFLFAMLGLGGGTVYTPVLMWAGFPVKEVAIPLGLLLNGLNTLLALIPFARKKLVDWKGGAFMAFTALVFAPLGALTTKYVPVKTLLLIFAVLVIIIALRMVVFAKNPEPETMMPLKKRLLIGGITGAVAAFLGGLLGVGGGFIIAPVLMWMGYKTKEAAATTAFVVTFSSFSGYFGHMAGGSINWKITIPVLIAVVIGSQAGAMFMAGNINPKVVKITYAVVLFLIAIKLITGVFGIL
jgi:uncharacterized membrane protein YfcA